MSTNDVPPTPPPQPPRRLRVTSKVDLVDFAVQVFNLGKEVVDEIRDDKHIWAFEEADLQSYEGSPDSKGFLTLANAFLTKVHHTLARARTLKPTSRADVKEEATAAVTCRRSKRLRKEDAGDEEIPCKKRTRTNGSEDARGKPSDEAVALPSVPQCLACVSHYFIVKIKVQGFQVTVVYYDQFLELVVAEFDFRERPQDLALALYGTNSIEAGRAGVDAHLRKWSPYVPGSGDGSEMFFYGTHKCAASCGLGGFLQFPSTNESAEPGLGRLNNNWVGSHFEMKDSTGKRLSFEITDVIQQPDQFVGDATVAYRMKLVRRNGVMLSPKEAAKTDSKVLRVSWPLDQGLDASEPTRTLYGSLGSDSWPQEIADFIIPPLQQFEATYTAEELNFSWNKLNLEIVDDILAQLNRTLRISVEEDCRPWCEVKDDKELVDVWRQCIERQNAVLKKTGFLHRNICDTSIMFYRSRGKARGVLKDWNLAAPNGTKDCFSPENKTFMAIDSLAFNGKFEYWQRHDLEAFFNALLWASGHYDLRSKSVSPTTYLTFHDMVEGRYVKKARLICDPKLHQQDYWNFRVFRNEFRNVVRLGIRPLSGLFRDGYENLRSFARGGPWVDWETHGGVLAYKAFMKVVRKFYKDLSDGKP